MRKCILVFVLVATVTAVAAADIAIPQPLSGAKPGEWVMLMEVAGENVGQKSKISVVELKEDEDGAVVVLKRERFDIAGDLVDEDELEVPMARYLERMDGLKEKATVTKETLAVKDTQTEVVAISWTDEENDREIKMWITDDVPVGGVVKSWSSDPEFPAVELVDFGS